MKQLPLSPLQSDNAHLVLGAIKIENNANTVNNNANTKDSTQKSKDFTISINEIHQYIVEIQGFMRISI